MTIDKENRPLVKAMIKTQYGPVIERTLCAFILTDLNEMMSSATISSKKQLSFQQYMQARQEFMLSTQVKTRLLMRLNSLRYLRNDMITEILKQYDLKLPIDEIAYYHDVLSEIAIKFEKKLEDWIKGNHYYRISNHLNKLTSH